MEINKVKKDNYGRPSGVLLLDKPAGISTHDLVDLARRTFNYRKIGHAGALDVFATGLAIILVGKYTKLSDSWLLADKKYQAQVLLGVATDTQDPEGTVQQIADKAIKLSTSELEAGLNTFLGKQQQYVSVFSSVKVGGKKLRKLMRSEQYDVKVIENSENKYIELTPKNSANETESIPVPRREIEIFSITMGEISELNRSNLPEALRNQILSDVQLQLLNIEVHCSKGTYIRQLAEDIGKYFHLPAMLLNLRRTAIADLSLADALKPEDLEELKSV